MQIDLGVKRLIKYLIIVSLVLFIPFISGKYVLVYPDMGYDTYHAYLPSYELIVNKIRSGSFSFMDFTYGLGSNTLGLAISMFDPFAIIPISIGLVFGVTNTAFGLVYMQMLKTVVAGILCYMYLSEFEYSRKSKMVASFAYGFSGYMFAAGQHYSFATIPVAFILILLFIEKAFKDRKYMVQLILSIAFMGILSAYFLFPTLLFYVVYVIVRIFALNKNMDIKRFFYGVIPFALSSIIGLMLSAVIFIPSVYLVMNVSGRISENVGLFNKITNAFTMISFADFKMSILKLFSENIQGTVNNWTGGQYHFGSPHYFFSILFALCLPQYIINSFSADKTKKEKVIKGIIILLVVFSVVNCFIGFLTNMFSVYYSRYTFVLLPLFGVVIAETLDRIFMEKRFNRVVNVTTMIVGVILVAVCYDRNSGIFSYVVAINAIGSLILSSLILDFVVTYNKENTRVPKLAFIMLSCIVALNVFTDDAVILYAKRGVVSNQELKNLYHDERIANIIQKLNDKEGNNFYRVDKDFNESTPMWVNSFINRYRSVSNYDSYFNKNSVQFVNKLGQKTSPGDILEAYACGSFGEMFDVVMSDNLGLKYIISHSKRSDEHWELVDNTGDLLVYKNRNINSAGLIYNNYMTESDFESLSLIQKKLFMTDGVIMDDVDSTYNKLTSVKYDDNTKALDFSNINKYNAWINEIPQIGEIIGSSYKDGAIDIPINPQLINNQNNQNVLSFNINSNSNFDMKVVFDVGHGFNYGEGVDYVNKVVTNTNNLIAFKVPGDAKAVRFVFDKTEFHITNLALSQKERSYTNDNIHFENPNLGNTVIGTVDMEKDGLLYMPIPYEDGWKAYVDNKEVKISKANFGFSAVELSSGNHQIKFEYTIPQLLLGSVVTLIGLIFLIMLCIFYKKTNSNRLKEF